jgi:hypothetical protein
MLLQKKKKIEWKSLNNVFAPTRREDRVEKKGGKNRMSSPTLFSRSVSLKATCQRLERRQ